MTLLSSLVRTPALLDEDDFASNSATQAPTQQSAKTFVNAQVSTPIYWNMLTAAPDVVGQGTWARSASTTGFYQGYLTNTTTGDGDNYTMNFRCPAGTYTLRFNAWKSVGAGIVDIYFDGGEEDSIDLYAVGSDALYIHETAGVVLGAGAHTLKFQIDGKNASSANYFFTHEAIYLQRTA